MSCEEEEGEETEGRGDGVGRHQAEYHGEGVGPQGFHHQTADTEPATAEYSHPGSLAGLTLKYWQNIKAGPQCDVTERGNIS